MAGLPLKRFIVIDSSDAVLIHAPTRIAALHMYEKHQVENGPPPISKAKPPPLEPITIYELSVELKG
jgi:hypothetical protein